MFTWTADVCTKTGIVKSVVQLLTKMPVKDPIVVKGNQTTCVLLNARDIVTAAQVSERVTKQLIFSQEF
jgi:hypothetical protein